MSGSFRTKRKKDLSPYCTHLVRQGQASRPPLAFPKWQGAFYPCVDHDANDFNVNATPTSATLGEKSLAGPSLIVLLSISTAIVGWDDADDEELCDIRLSESVAAA